MILYLNGKSVWYIYKALRIKLVNFMNPTMINSIYVTQKYDLHDLSVLPLPFQNLSGICEVNRSNINKQLLEVQDVY